MSNIETKDIIIKNNNNNNNSVNLFMCLTTARYDQLQPSTKTAVQVNIKKTDEIIIKCTVWNLQGVNQFKSIQTIYLGAWQQLKS
jgi:hypothetical protein